MAADERFSGALRALFSALDEIGAPWMIIGGVAVIAAGVPRQTIDIDATILGRSTTPEAVLEVLGRHSIVPRIPGALEFARERQVLLLRHESSGVTIEISFAWLPFEEQALEHAREVDSAGVNIRVARPEDLIVYKFTAWRDRDRSDVERLLALHIDDIDLDRVRNLAREIASVLGEPERLTALEVMIERIGENR